MARIIRGDLTGRTFNYWTVLSRVPSAKKNQVAIYLCRCKCGTEKQIRAPHLYYENSRSCGCYQKERVSKHGKSRTPIYQVWRNIKVRCLVESNPDYPNYGGRGITICSEWADSFHAFYAYVGDPPSNYHKIERIDNNGNYEPGNVRWATQREQLANRRTTKKFLVDGVERPISEIARENGINNGALQYRLLVKKMPLKEALTLPIRRRIIN